MLARSFALALLLEVAFFVGLAVHGFDASPATAGAFALAGVLVLRALLIGVIYALARRWSAAVPHLSLGQRLRMVLAEYAAHVLTFVVIFPLERWWMAPDRLRSAAPQGDPQRRTPVLLVHGYCCSRASWWWLRRRLETAGWTVATITLEPVYAAIDSYVEPLAHRIDAVLDETGASQLVLVGHSMGGLVARAYLQRFGDARVKRLITLGTPHQGSRLAELGLGENGRQMRPGSRWLESLAWPPAKVGPLVIYSPHDEFVTPQHLLRLPLGKHEEIAGLGHLAMLYSPRVWLALQQGLEQTVCDDRPG